jgi:hypothetical protein
MRNRKAPLVARVMAADKVLDRACGHPDLSCHVLRYGEGMADQWYSSGHRTVPPKEHPGESLWTLERNGRRVACELRDHGEPAGAEVQLLQNGEFYAGRRFDTRAMALQHADYLRENLERDGWRAECPSPTA